MAITLAEAPAILLSAMTYHPFSPDAGIFAGGYQGYIYPNPTTLVLTGFDPFKFIAIPISPYTIKSTGDIYEGLGKGNPSISYFNGGHLIGLVDTYGRMSYGLQILKSLRAGESKKEDFDPIVEVKINFIKFNLTAGNSITAVNNDGSNTEPILGYYPNFTESPDKYLGSFVNDVGRLILDPRTDEPFNYTDPYEQTTSELSQSILTGFFGINTSTMSYYTIPDQIREFFTEMAEFTVTNTFNEEVSVPIDREGLGADGEEKEGLPIPIEPCEFPESLTSEVNPPTEIEGGDPIPLGQDIFDPEDAEQTLPLFKHKCEILTINESLKLLTGESRPLGDGEIFHKGSEGGNNNVLSEFRTLTELNSVINLVPIQTSALRYTYWDDNIWNDELILFAIGKTHRIWTVTDIILHTNVGGIINIEGIATIENPIDGESIFQVAGICRQCSFSTSLTNNFIWNRRWFGVDAINSKTKTDKEKFMISPGFQGSIDFFGEESFTVEFLGSLPSDPYERSTDFNFSESINVPEGGHTIRARLIIQSQIFDFVGYNPDNIELELTVNGDNIDLTHSFTIPGVGERPEEEEEGGGGGEGGGGE